MAEDVLVDARTLTVPVSECGAQMRVPRADWLWNLRYGRDASEHQMCSDRMMAASICESYRFLVMECTKEEAWSRIKKMRAAIRNHDTAEAK